LDTADVKLARDQHVWAFAADMQPVVTVDPGTVLEVETWDCFTGQVRTEADTLELLDHARINSATGPIAVRGAEPGDSLSVTVLDIESAPEGAAMVIPDSGQLIEFCKAPQTRIFQIRDGVVTMNDRVSFPWKPMIGVVGVAPAMGSISTFLAGKHGGNLDDTVNGIGATLHMPVFQSGGQLALGDMHASMGDGEISDTGVEISGKALIKVDLIKGRAAGWPVTEHADCWYTHGTTADSLEDAVKIACEEAAKLLVDQWGFTMEDAFVFLSATGDLGIAQACKPCTGSVIARMRVPSIPACPHPFRV
jgi:amidase